MRRREESGRARDPVHEGGVVITAERIFGMAGGDGNRYEGGDVECVLQSVTFHGLWREIFGTSSPGPDGAVERELTAMKLKDVSVMVEKEGEIKVVATFLDLVRLV